MQIYNPSASFARPADTTAYAAGDLVANSTTAGSVLPLSFTMQSNIIIGPFSLWRCRLRKSTTSVSNANFRVHLYEASPTPANGDNGAYTTDKAANYLGFINVDMTTTPGAKFNDGAVGIGSASAGADFNVRLVSGTTVYALIEALAAYTPGNAETFALTLELIEHYPRGG
jgi:hypothetical protein